MHSVIVEGLVRIAFFLAAVSTYIYMVWGEKVRASVVFTPGNLPDTMGDQPTPTLFLIRKASSPAEPRAGGVAGKAPNQSKLAAAGDWLVPVIVWFLVIMMGVAVVGFLLGDK
jgi:hypothetical protein